MFPVVAIGLKGPPVELPGFISNMSIVLGPPPIHNKMAALRFRFQYRSMSIQGMPHRQGTAGQRGCACQVAHEMPTTHSRGGSKVHVVPFQTCRESED